VGSTPTSATIIKRNEPATCPIQHSSETNAGLSRVIPRTANRPVFCDRVSIYCRSIKRDWVNRFNLRLLLPAPSTRRISCRIAFELIHSHYPDRERGLAATCSRLKRLSSVRRENPACALVACSVNELPPVGQMPQPHWKMWHFPTPRRIAHSFHRTSRWHRTCLSASHEVKQSMHFGYSAHVNHGNSRTQGR
jgi:hypothetical protein